jgi:hypothetical protein
MGTVMIIVVSRDPSIPKELGSEPGGTVNPGTHWKSASLFLSIRGPRFYQDILYLQFWYLVGSLVQLGLLRSRIWASSLNLWLVL